MGALLGVSRVIDAVSFRIGKTLSWLILAAVIVSAVNAIIRKVFDTSSNSWLELQWVLFGAVFLLVASWTLLDNEHIRIDIVNSLFSQRTRNIIDVIGHALFLLPLTIVMIITSVSVRHQVGAAQRAVDECGRTAAMAREDADPGRLHSAVLPGDLRADQAHCGHDGHHPRSVPHAGGVRAAAEAEVERLLAEAKALEAEQKSR